MEKRNLVLAFYLPQFHSIPENDEWWGTGFTEWTNVAKASPLFNGHYQPIKPGELGYYNLLDINVHHKQGELAKEHLIDGFCYYHYWFGNEKKLLEKPIELVRNTKEWNFKYCLCWANETWSGVWHGAPGKILQRQLYPGKKDIIAHLKYLIHFFEDKRYIRYLDKPLMLIHRIKPFLSNPSYIEMYHDLLWKEFKIEVSLIAGYADYDHHYHKVSEVFVGKASSVFKESIEKFRKESKIKFFLKRLGIDFYKKPLIIKYDYIRDAMIEKYQESRGTFPVVVPNWDDTPRVGKEESIILKDHTAESFKKVLEVALNNKIRNRNIVFIKSWNEWGEGNYLEPDSRFGNSFLKATKETISKFAQK